MKKETLTKYFVLGLFLLNLLSMIFAFTIKETVAIFWTFNSLSLAISAFIVILMIFFIYHHKGNPYEYSKLSFAIIVFLLNIANIVLISISQQYIYIVGFLHLAGLVITVASFVTSIINQKTDFQITYSEGIDKKLLHAHSYEGYKVRIAYLRKYYETIYIIRMSIGIVFTVILIGFIYLLYAKIEYLESMAELDSFEATNLYTLYDEEIFKRIKESNTIKIESKEPENTKNNH